MPTRDTAVDVDEKQFCRAEQSSAISERTRGRSLLPLIILTKIGDEKNFIGALDERECYNNTAVKKVNECVGYLSNSREKIAQPLYMRISSLKYIKLKE